MALIHHMHTKQQLGCASARAHLAVQAREYKNRTGSVLQGRAVIIATQVRWGSMVRHAHGCNIFLSIGYHIDMVLIR